MATPDAPDPAPIDPEDMKIVADLVHAASRRAFWFTSLLGMSAALVATLAIAGATGIQARADEWPSVVLGASFVLSACGMVVSFVLYTVRNAETQRAIAALRASKLADLGNG